MIELTSLVSSFGLPVVLGAAIVFVLLKSEVQFRYPRKTSGTFGRRRDQETTAEISSAPRRNK